MVNVLKSDPVTYHSGFTCAYVTHFPLLHEFNHCLLLPALQRVLRLRDATGIVTEHSVICRLSGGVIVPEC